MMNLLASSFAVPDPVKHDQHLLQSRSASQASFSGSVKSKSSSTSRRSRHGDTSPVGTSRPPSRKTMPRRRSTVNQTQRSLVNIPELFVQTGVASIDGPMPTLVRANPHYQRSVESLNENSWQENEIPEELGYVNGEEPEEIRNIIQESLDEHRALRASQLHTQAIVVRTTITMSSSGSDSSTVCPNVETSATASIRSRSFDLNRSPERPSSSDRSSPDSLALASTKSGNSIYFDAALNNLRSSTELVLSSSQESLSVSSSRAKSSQEIRRELRTKPSRNQILFKFLGRGPKGFQFPHDTPAEIKECTSCFDSIPDLQSVLLPCRHPYCGSCFSQLVSTALQSEDTFPPKCCLQEIPRRILDTSLSSPEMIEYDQKALEYAIDVASRYYCGSPECAKWIDTRKANRQNGSLECPHCKFWMCTSCRGAQHTANEDCPQDFGLSAALEQAERAGWRRCYNCRTMVELNTGCRHITCKCKAEFWFVSLLSFSTALPALLHIYKTLPDHDAMSSYTCGARWRTCTCTEADQTRRETEIEERLARFNAELRAEEAEVRAAILAVERAERQVAAEREAEEARNAAQRLREEQEEMARLEYARVEGINAYFDILRSRLEHVLCTQREALEARHATELPRLEAMADQIAKHNIALDRNRQITKERISIITKQDVFLDTLRARHSAEIASTSRRHDQTQDAVFLQPLPSPSLEPQRGNLTSPILSSLTDLQQLEVSTLQAMHERELSKWRKRHAIELQDFDDIMREELARFRKMHSLRLEEVGKLVQVGKRAVRADWKWVDTLARVRRGMVDEDEERMIVSGGDAPVIVPVEEAM